MENIKLRNLLWGIVLVYYSSSIVGMQLSKPVPRRYNMKDLSPEARAIIRKMEERRKEDFAIAEQSPKLVPITNPVQEKASQIQQQAQLKKIEEDISKKGEFFVYQEGTLNGVGVSRYIINLCDNIKERIERDKESTGKIQRLISVPYSFNIISNVFGALNSGGYEDAAQKLSYLTVQELIDSDNFTIDYLGVKESIRNVFAFAIVFKIDDIIYQLEVMRRDVGFIKTYFPGEHTIRGLFSAIKISKDGIFKMGQDLAQINNKHFDGLSLDLNTRIMNTLQKRVYKMSSGGSIYFPNEKSIKEHYENLWKIKFESFNKLKIYDLLNGMKQFIELSLKEKEESIKELEEEHKGIKYTILYWLGI